MVTFLRAMLIAVVALTLLGCARTGAWSGTRDLFRSAAARRAEARRRRHHGGDATALKEKAYASSGATPGVDGLSDFVTAGLTALDLQGRLLPRLAAETPTLENGLWKLLPDGRMEITWHLWPAHWHDGTPFTTDDLLFSFRVAQDRRPGHPVLECARLGRSGVIRSYAHQHVFESKTLVRVALDIARTRLVRDQLVRSSPAELSLRPDRRPRSAAMYQGGQRHMEIWIRQGMGYHCQPMMPFPVPGWLWDRQLGQGMYHERMRFIRRVDELGFDGLIFTEHHYGPNGGLTPSPNIMMAAAAGVTEHVKLITMGNIIALHGHPVRLAEELAMIDNLSHGRLVSGFITGNEEALFSYGVSVPEGRGRHAEAFDLIVKAWTEENPFEWHGEYFNYDCVSILPRPVQQPHPPVWTAAASAESLEWAARHRVGLVASGTDTRKHDAFGYWSQQAEAAGWTPTTQDRAVTCEFYLAPTQREVQEFAERVLLRPRRRLEEAFKDEKLLEISRDKWDPSLFTYWTEPFENPRGMEPGKSLEDIQRRGVYLVGDPDQVTAQLLRWRTEFDISAIAIRLESAVQDLDVVTKELELFAREVLPVVQKA